MFTQQLTCTSSSPAWLFAFTCLNNPSLHPFGPLVHILYTHHTCNVHAVASCGFISFLHSHLRQAKSHHQQLSKPCTQPASAVDRPPFTPDGPCSATCLTHHAAPESPASTSPQLPASMADPNYQPTWLSLQPREHPSLHAPCIARAPHPHDLATSHLTSPANVSSLLPTSQPLASSPYVAHCSRMPSCPASHANRPRAHLYICMLPYASIPHAHQGHPPASFLTNSTLLLATKPHTPPCPTALPPMLQSKLGYK